MKKKLKLRAGDQVVVTAGKDRGKNGKILKVLPKLDRVLVEGVNVTKKHVRATQDNPSGGVTEKSLPLHISNVMLVDPEKGTPTRVGRRIEKKGKSEVSVRFAKRSGATLD